MSDLDSAVEVVSKWVDSRMALVAFLDARLAEEASRVTRLDSARTVRELTAKRRIVAAVRTVDIAHGDAHITAEFTVGTLLCVLASIYADHPDFDPAWSLDGG